MQQLVSLRSLRRHYPASSVIQAPPPPRPARPVPRGIPVGACHTTDGASRVASSFLFHACQRQYPGGSGQCFHRSLPGRHRSSPFPRRVDSHIARSGPARRSLTFRPACLLNRLSRSFCQSASIHVVTSMNRPDCYQPETIVAGRDSHPLERGAFHGARGSRVSTERI